MKNLISLLLLFIMMSCGTGRIATTETTSKETIIFGKLVVQSDMELLNKKILMHFNERLWAKNAVWLDENGYFYMKMPIGYNFIALLEYRGGMGFYKNIPDDYVSINVPLADKVYYIGDINFTWTPSKSDKRINGGVIGIVADANKEGEKAKVTVSSSDSTTEYFRQKFPANKKDIVTSLAVVKE